MAEQLNVNFKRFITQVQQAKKSGASEFRMPLRMAEDLIMELTVLMADKISEYKENLENQPVSTFDGKINLSGGSF